MHWLRIKNTQRMQSTFISYFKEFGAAILGCNFLSGESDVERNFHDSGYQVGDRLLSSQIPDLYSTFRVILLPFFCQRNKFIVTNRNMDKRQLQDKTRHSVKGGGRHGFCQLLFERHDISAWWRCAARVENELKVPCYALWYIGPS